MSTNSAMRDAFSNYADYLNDIVICLSLSQFFFFLDILFYYFDIVAYSIFVYCALWIVLYICVLDTIIRHVLHGRC